MPRKSSAQNAPKRSDSNVRLVIGANIKARRQALDWSQQELADRFGVSRAAVSQYEIGTGEVNAGDLPRLARILGIHLLDFYRPPARADQPAQAAATPQAASRRLLEAWERGLLNGDDRKESSGPSHEGQTGSGTGVGEGDTEDDRVPMTEPISFVPTKNDGRENDDPAPGLPRDISDDLLEIAGLFQTMTPLERSTLLRIARVLIRFCPGALPPQNPPI